MRTHPNRRVVAATLVAAVSLSFVAFTPARTLAAPAPSTRFENPVLRVDVTGKGRPMVLIPGLTCPADVWRETVARYADRYECHAVTLGGFAGRPRFEGPFIDTARDSLLAYFRARGLQRPVIVGHSLGGVLALELATTAPDAVGPLVIVDALPFLGGAGDTTATAESARKAMEPMWTMMRSQTQEAYAAYQRQAPWLRSMVAPGPNLDRVLEWAVTSDRIAVADAMYDITSRDLRGRLAGLRSPVLVLGSWYGMKDYTSRDAVAATYRRQYNHAPRWSLALADTARHFIMLDSPDWTWSQMDAFLGAAGSSARLTDGHR
jgi:pimeloyl-ACP methyl ester carboxylesterase